MIDADVAETAALPEEAQSARNIVTIYLFSLNILFNCHRSSGPGVLAITTWELNDIFTDSLIPLLPNMTNLWTVKKSTIKTPKDEKHQQRITLHLFIFFLGETSTWNYVHLIAQLERKQLVRRKRWISASVGLLARNASPSVQLGQDVHFEALHSPTSDLTIYLLVLPARWVYWKRKPKRLWDSAFSLTRWKWWYAVCHLISATVFSSPYRLAK